ncbi:MAG: response regulator transcription factor [Bacteroidetes bacterium]|nr:response regulator transcription factor [Bacteroidota bacterium]
MELTKILLADSQVLTSEGITSVLKSTGNYNIIGYTESSNELFSFFKKNTPSILIIDPFRLNDFLISFLANLTDIFPSSRILVLTGDSANENIIKILDSGITHFISKYCTKDELLNALTAIERDENYLCKEVVEALLKENLNISKNKSTNTHLTKKEFEIIRLIAQGLTTKEIAAKDFLSVHTVNTHRKNILKKLGINSTSELIMYAVKTGIVDTTEYYI